MKVLAVEQQKTFSYDGYQVVRKELFAHLRDPAIVIRKDSITFNTACISGLEDVVYVHVMFNSDFVRMVYKNAQWDKRRSYRMIGNLFPEQRLVSFQIQEALPIENGRVLDGTGSPTFALCRAEGSPSQNNPTPEEKADSGAM